MECIFPEIIRQLPHADLSIPGARAWISQAKDHQILFMTFAEDVNVLEHTHDSQWGVVLEGRIDLVIDGTPHTFTKGDRYFIPAGIKHSAYIYAGYSDISYFSEASRFQKSKSPI